MKIGVFSDTHDNLKNLSKAVDIFLKSEVQALIHAGDFCSPFVFNMMEKIKPVCPKMYAVFGNNDGDKLLLTQKAGSFCIIKDIIHEIEIAGKRIVVMHYPELAEPFFACGSYDLVVCGHSHQQILKGEKKLLLNPGSCGGYQTEWATITVVDLKTMQVEIISL
jgi:putative phosphoesterase